MIRYAVTFLSGSLVPVICIYLTGGSNRTNLMIGLILGLSLVLIPVLYFRLQAARALLALDHALKVFAGVFKYGKLPVKVASSVNTAINGPKTPHATRTTKRFDVQEDVEFMKDLNSPDTPTPTPTPTPTIAPAPEPEPEPDPIVGDVTSALINLGTPHKKAERVARQVAAHQKYERFEDMFKDALDVVKVGA
jgi:hypothetical protein